MSLADEGKTPDEWVAWFAERGIRVSVRRLRETAIAKGACKKLGNVVLITPDQLDQIFEQPKPAERKQAASDAGTYRPANTTEKALEHLDRMSRRKTRT